MNPISHILVLSIFLLLPYSNPEKKSDPTTKQEKEQVDTNNEVSIELSMPHGDSLKLFGPCWSENEVDVIIRNGSDSTIHFYENWNSWGYFNFHFELETADSLYHIKREDRLWWRNFPSFHSINPDESLVFHFNVLDSACFDQNARGENIRSLKNWTGFPQTNYERAKLRVVYELPEESHILPRREYSRDSVKLNPIYMFSEKLVSKDLNITVIR